MRRAGQACRTLAWLATALVGCRPWTTSAVEASAVPAPELAQGEHDGFWWTELGEQSAAVASFGPTFELPAGRFRQWSLVVFLPGSPEPLSCVQGLVDLAGNTPILARGSAFAVELEPCEGCSWEEIRADEQLVARSEGIY